MCIVLWSRNFMRELRKLLFNCIALICQRPFFLTRYNFICVCSTNRRRHFGNYAFLGSRKFSTDLAAFWELWSRHPIGKSICIRRTSPRKLPLPTALPRSAFRFPPKNHSTIASVVSTPWVVVKQAFRSPPSCRCGSCFFKRNHVEFGSVLMCFVWTGVKLNVFILCKRCAFGPGSKNYRQQVGESISYCFGKDLKSRRSMFGNHGSIRKMFLEESSHLKKVLSSRLNDPLLWITRNRREDNFFVWNLP